MTGRRKHERVAIRLHVEYEDGADLIDDYTENLSSNGTFILTSRAFDVDTQLELVLSFPGLLDPVALDAVVKWSRAGRQPGVGVEFLPCAGRARLDVLIAQLSSGDDKAIARVVRVLVAEDNRHLAELICHGLVAAARRTFADTLTFVPEAAADGRAALSLLQEGAFDAAIIDLELPLVDGSRVIDYTRSRLGLVDLPIIAVSTQGEPARAAALAVGASAYLPKPMRLRQVIDSLDELGVTACPASNGWR